MTLHSILSRSAAAALLLVLAACGGSDNGAPSTPPGGPTVMSSTPTDGATHVALDGTISATFSEAMDPNTLNTSTFTLTSGAGAIPVAGTVTYAASQVVFLPAVQLANDASFTATVSTGAKSAGGTSLAAKRSWSFATGTSAVLGHPVNLGTSANYAILAKSGISTVPSSAIIGDLGVSPIDATAITGFSLTADSTNVFSTSPQVTGHVFAADYATPTPSGLTSAIGDMQLAFTDAAGRAPGVTELGAGNIGGMTLAPGVYKWGTGLLIPTDVTLNGQATDLWIFQIAQDLTVSGGARVVLAGGALPRNVIWQVSGLVEVGTTAHVEGVILSQTAINLRTGASINGRLLAQTAVTLDGATVVQPAP
jgi:hypothetical protein